MDSPTDNYKGGFEQLAAGGRYLLGATPGSKAEPFQGAMTEVRVWNKRLNKEEINAEILSNVVDEGRLSMA